MEKKLSLFTENGDLTDNKLVQGMFLGRLGLSYDDMNKVLNGERTLNELVKGTNVREVEVIKEVPVEKIKEVVREVPVEVPVEKIVEKEVIVEKPITTENIVEYITSSDPDIRVIIDALDQCNYLPVVNTAGGLDSIDMYDIGTYILQNGKTSFLYKLYDKIGEKLKNSSISILDTMDILHPDKVNKMIDEKIDNSKATEYFKRLLLRDQSVPLAEMVRCLNYLPNANIRKARTTGELDKQYYCMITSIDYMRTAKNSIIYLMVDFSFAAKTRECNKLGTINKLHRLDRYDSIIDSFAKILKKRVESATCYISNTYNRDYIIGKGTLMDAIARVITKDKLVDILKSIGYVNVDTNTLTDKFFILNWKNGSYRNTLLSTNNPLFLEIDDLYVNGFSIYDHFIGFIKELFNQVEDTCIEPILKCLVNYKVVPKMYPGSEGSVNKICREAFDKNKETFKGGKSNVARLLDDTDWKVAKNVTNPMIALNAFIPSIELSTVLHCSTGAIMSACKNQNHELNNMGNWKYGVKTGIARLCVKHRVNLLPILELYVDSNANDITSVRSAFYKELKINGIAV